ncbi:MAG: glycosyltransferase [Microscillaceae bacterium]|nr:glycosyltransferase [Microscillaceae bacterium]
MLSTSDLSGGAAIACYRLFLALQSQPELEVRLLVQHQQRPHPQVNTLATSFWQKQLAQVRFATERLDFWRLARNKEVRFAFSTASTGAAIHTHPWVQEADVLHLHWINFGFLSLSSIQKLAALGKPLVWTLQDMWAFTGGCHYTGACRGFERQCGHCPFLKNPHSGDLSHRVWKRKKTLFEAGKWVITPTSQWLASEAGRSSLLSSCRIEAIPAPIDTQMFCPDLSATARQILGLPSESFLLLFGAAKINDPRKGIAYLREALNYLRAQKESLPALELLVFGQDKAQSLADWPFPVHYLGQLAPASVIKAYQAANAFVMPSLEDNLPNTILESLSCGTPVIAFSTGGIPEMIHHQVNGYLAQPQNAVDLARGIQWLYHFQPRETLRRAARQKIETNFRPKL